ncbi:MULTISPECIES: type I-F CRISPR-associated endoribonuclease Cas6/Csy4 [unclassified Oleiphilus]|uniref:type I-F CRISPR-associated endoribonuclease Cas6/Csy4 n=1 Tax=unclassified Oleiphilus TaxID=2631174 RepID=UPI0007C3D8D0|nr:MULTISPECIES: type I-F CRISPR-associated endoribonuclease Cas6/Csy4 [unclassified Oleiphilus]KZY43677.1 hypothetical protein A3732_13850 [Oleiphilus sp. HI0050]KZZ32461.1 hypothetical protein A3756_20280 [Oleiphilus sp. HI0086]KZZ34721.1 hypothetical protein A3756_03030 [Oleiphilus sp. HI0086]KZZ40308.1 hypothetical protein A3757_00120 [Oleiphilus sp. HI0117]KZZ55193.1 hypothetical protein A3761_12545 [Oleiphilus sp. HI0123]
MGVSVDARVKFQFIEVLLQWEGKLTTRKLIEQFGISRTSAQKWITEYRSAVPQNLDLYDSNEKCHRPSDQFQPCFTSGELEEYLSFFDGGWVSSHLQLIAPPVRNIKQYKAKMFNQSLDNPYVELVGGSNGEKHRRFIEFGPVMNEPVSGSFNQFGLSKNATVPWF